MSPTLGDGRESQPPDLRPYRKDQPAACAADKKEQGRKRSGVRTQNIGEPGVRMGNADYTSLTCAESGEIADSRFIESVI